MPGGENNRREIENVEPLGTELSRGQRLYEEKRFEVYLHSEFLHKRIVRRLVHRSLL